MLVGLVEALVSVPQQLVAHISMLPEAEHQQLLVEWNGVVNTVESSVLTHQLFNTQAALHPNRIALAMAGQTLAYGELDCAANQLAHYLIQKGVTPDVRVGLYVERSLQMVIGVLAILKAGGCYVPLDPMLPEGRLEVILDDLMMVCYLLKFRWRTKFSICHLVSLCLIHRNILSM